jgi:hypothetical protein
LIERREEEYETSIEVSFSPSSLSFLFFELTDLIHTQTDVALLADASLPPRHRMAIIVRLGEKRILRATREALVAEFPVGAAAAPAPDGTKNKEKKRGREDKGDGRAKKTKMVK